MTPEILYVRRPADFQLPNALLRGRFCAVSGPRQVGKSSLLSHALAALATRDRRGAFVDLAALGHRRTEEAEWFAGLALEAGGQLLQDTVEAQRLWASTEGLSPTHRWSRLLCALLPEALGAPFTLLVDNVDPALLPRDALSGLITSIHSLYDAKGRQAALQSTSVALASPFSPGRLAAVTGATLPGGLHLALSDFSVMDARELKAGLSGLGFDPEALLDAIMGWTSGHPSLTLRLCRALREIPTGLAASAEEWVAQAATQALLRGGREEVPELATAHTVLVPPDRPAAPRIQLLADLAQGEAMPFDADDPIQRDLIDGGLAAVRPMGGQPLIQIRNQIVARLCEPHWLESLTPAPLPPEISAAFDVDEPLDPPADDSLDQALDAALGTPLPDEEILPFSASDEILSTAQAAALGEIVMSAPPADLLPSDLAPTPPPAPAELSGLPMAARPTPDLSGVSLAVTPAVEAQPDPQPDPIPPPTPPTTSGPPRPPAPPPVAPSAPSSKSHALGWAAALIFAVAVGLVAYTLGRQDPQQADGEVTALQSQLAEARQAEAAAKDEAQQAAAAAAHSAAAEIQTLKAALAEAEKARDDLRQQRDSAQQKVTTAEQALAAAEAARRQLAAEGEAREAALVEAQAKAKAAARRAAAAQAAAKRGGGDAAALARLKAEAAKARAAQSEAQARLSNLKSELTQAKAQREKTEAAAREKEAALRSDLAAQREAAAAAQAALDAAEQDLKGQDEVAPTKRAPVEKAAARPEPTPAPATALAAPAEPAPVEPAPVEPAPAEPEPVKPTPVEIAPAKPAPAATALAEPAEAPAALAPPLPLDDPFAEDSPAEAAPTKTDPTPAPQQGAPAADLGDGLDFESPY